MIMNITDLLKDPNKIKKVLWKAIKDKNKEAAETLISVVKDPELTYEYARNIVKGKIKDEWEDIIATNPTYSYRYAEKVLKGPFPKGEDSIAKDYWCSYYYAYEVLKGPFPKGEDVIAKNPNYSYLYADLILKDRFIEREKAIIRNRNYLKDYMKFLKQIGKLEEFLNDHPRVKPNLTNL